MHGFHRRLRRTTRLAARGAPIIPSSTPATGTNNNQSTQPLSTAASTYPNSPLRPGRFPGHSYQPTPPPPPSAPKVVPYRNYQPTQEEYAYIQNLMGTHQPVAQSTPTLTPVAAFHFAPPEPPRPPFLNNLGPNGGFSGLISQAAFVPNVRGPNPIKKPASTPTDNALLSKQLEMMKVGVAGAGMLSGTPKKHRGFGASAQPFNADGSVEVGG